MGRLDAIKQQTLKEWRRLMSEYELGSEGRRDFYVRHGLATSILEYWRRRSREDESWQLVCPRGDRSGCDQPAQGSAGGVANGRIVGRDARGLWRGQHMFALRAATKVYLATGATDPRKGRDGLCAIVEGVLEEAPLSGHVFSFANEARASLMVLVWDGSGMWVYTKKLGRGRYAWPTMGEGETRRLMMSQSELMLLLSGLDSAATKQRELWRIE
jgi:transposase